MQSVSPERFPRKILEDIDDGGLRALAQRISDWKGAPAKHLQLAIDSEFLNRGYRQ